jgi:hypothetical protein
LTACFCDDEAASCALRKEVGTCTSLMPRKRRPAASPNVFETIPPPTGIMTVLRLPPDLRNCSRIVSSVATVFAASVSPITQRSKGTPCLASSASRRGPQCFAVISSYPRKT